MHPHEAKSLVARAIADGLIRPAVQVPAPQPQHKRAPRGSLNTEELRRAAKREDSLRWRERHPELYRERSRIYSARYKARHAKPKRVPRVSLIGEGYSQSTPEGYRAYRREWMRRTRALAKQQASAIDN